MSVIASINKVSYIHINSYQLLSPFWKTPQVIQCGIMLGLIRIDYMANYSQGLYLKDSQQHKSCLNACCLCNSKPNKYTHWQQAFPEKTDMNTHRVFKTSINQVHSRMRNRSLEGPKRSVLAKLTNGNLIPQQHNPPAVPNYPTEGANRRDYIYRVKFSSTSSLGIGAGAFVAQEGPPQSNLAVCVWDFDVLKVDLTCVYGLINLGWKAVERTDWCREGMDRGLLSSIVLQQSMCFVL